MDNTPASKPNHIVFIVADSLRYDSVYSGDGVGANYLEGNAIQFLNASSPACWTLPSTASLFTGCLPHEHKATTQTRALKDSALTLAQVLKQQGYSTYQLSSNIATTEIFGLHKGFNKVIKTWDLAEQKGLKISQLFVLLGKRRIRKKLFSQDAIKESLSSDIRAGSVWFRSYYQIIFDHARTIMAEHDKKNEKAFLFLNLMETHFPYHIDHAFSLSSSNPFKNISELKTMFNIVNQTFLTKENSLPPQKALKKVKSRQRKSWELIRQDLDEFIRSIHEDKNNLVVFTSDHGENFGDQNWVYHFSNVTDACTRVPIFWLDNDTHQSGVKNHLTSSRLLFHSLAKKAGYDQLNGQDLFAENIFSIPISQSYWYNNHGKTLDKYKYNQFCFHYNGTRYLKKNGSWASAPTTQYDDNGVEESFKSYDQGSIDPLIDFVDDTEVRNYISKHLKEYSEFESKIKR